MAAFSGFRNAIVAGVTLVREAIQSPNFVAGVSGWSINKDGSAEFQDAVVRAELEVLSFTARDPVSGGAVIIDPATFGSLDTRIEFTPANAFGGGEDNGLVGVQNQLVAGIPTIPTLSLRSPAAVAGAVSTIDLVGEPELGGSTSIELTTDTAVISNDAQVGRDLSVGRNLTVAGRLITASRATNATVTDSANSTALFNVTGLALPLDAGKAYRYKLIMRYAATTTADFRMGLSLPVGADATCTWFWARDLTPTAVQGVTNNGGVTGLFGNGVGSPQLFMSEGIIVGGAANGILQVQAGKNVAEASTVSVFRSCLDLEPLT